MKNFQVILLCLVILLNPNFIFSQGLERWIKLNESNVYNFLRNLTGEDVSKKLHSQGINMYVSNHNYMESDLFVTSSFMVTFDSGIPVQFGESLWIKDKINRKGQYDNENLLKNILFDETREDFIKKYNENITFKILKDSKNSRHFIFKVKDKFYQEIPNTRNTEIKIYNQGENLIYHINSVRTRDIENVKNELLYGKLDVSKINMYDIHELIDVFIKEMKYFSNKYLSENFESSYQNSSKVDSFIKMVENSDINVDFDLKVSGVLGISKSMNDDSKISISINPILWKNSSDSKRLYIIYHELGHDILNFKHGEGGKMMFPISENEYNYNEFYNDREYMFNRFFKNLFTQ